MKKLALGIAFAVALIIAVPAHANSRQSDGRWWWHPDKDSAWGHNKDSDSSANTPTSVPEPSTILMFGSGLLTLAGFGFFRRNTAI
jgi:hypothetical protein